MRTKIKSINQLNAAEIQSMYEIMQEYYLNVTKENFIADLVEKQKVILLFGKDRCIKGFSTIFELIMDVEGKKVVALYSGDTILTREYWGNGALAMTFGRYLINVKFRNPLKPVYWFLISKGYKTYLLMTNNFAVHYPRFEEKTPQAFKKIMDVFYANRFGKKYLSNQGLIHFESESRVQLKDFVAEITDECRTNPRIAFFEQKNPNWKDGVELACVAKVSLWVPFRYVLKRVRKVLLKNGKGLETVYHK